MRGAGALSQKQTEANGTVQNNKAEALSAKEGARERMAQSEAK